MQASNDNTEPLVPTEGIRRNCTVDPLLKELLISSSRKKRPGMILDRMILDTISGKSIVIPQADRVMHLQFRRFAGCPVCNLHLQSFARRHEEIALASIHEVVIFHSSTEELLIHADDLPFDVIADPQKNLYTEFGVESSPRALLTPGAWLPVLRGVLNSLWEIVWLQRPVPPLKPQGGSLGLPADFLIGPGGYIIASKYGTHADDQWSVDDMLEVARSEPVTRLATKKEAAYE